MNEAREHLRQVRKKAAIHFAGMFIFIVILWGICSLFKNPNVGASAAVVEANQGKIGPWSSYFTVIDSWESKGNHFYVVYADNNYVMYMIVVGYNSSGITALYNPDGSLQVYKED